VEGTFLGPDELVRLAAGAVDESWWDDVETPEKEGRSQIVDRVLDSLDADRPGRTWGEVHTVTFQHPLGSAPLIGPMLNLLLSPAPVPLGGDGSTVNRAAYSLDYPWGVTVIPSMRFVAAVGEWDHSVLVVPPGASGRPWSSHYMDQLPAWSRGEGVPLPFTQAAVERATMARIELTPAADR
jgi:penicillin amidase